MRIDGEPLRASGAASSFGVGAMRRASVPARALQVAGFVAGSIGVQVIDDPAGGHDEGAWLGYTAFDPRPVIAELAEVRSSLREMLKGDRQWPSTTLLVSQTRPLGSFTTTPRWSGALLQVSPAEPWAAGLRVSMAQQLARPWIGGLLRLAAEPGPRSGEAALVRRGGRALRRDDRPGAPRPARAQRAARRRLRASSRSWQRPRTARSTTHTCRPLADGDPVARATLMARGASTRWTSRPSSARRTPRAPAASSTSSRGLSSRRSGPRAAAL